MTYLQLEPTPLRYVSVLTLYDLDQQERIDISNNLHREGKRACAAIRLIGFAT